MATGLGSAWWPTIELCTGTTCAAGGWRWVELVSAKETSNNITDMAMDQYLYIPIFSGMNIHLPAILMFTRGTRVLTHCHIYRLSTISPGVWNL